MHNVLLSLFYIQNLISVLLDFHDPGIKTELDVFAYGQNLTVITDPEQHKM